MEVREKNRGLTPAQEMIEQLDLSPAEGEELMRLAEAGLLRSGDPGVVTSLARRFSIAPGELRRVARRLGGAAERARWQEVARAVAPKRRFQHEGASGDHGIDPDLEPAAGPDGPAAHPADELLR